MSAASRQAIAEFLRDVDTDELPDCLWAVAELPAVQDQPGLARAVSTLAAEYDEIGCWENRFMCDHAHTDSAVEFAMWVEDLASDEVCAALGEMMAAAGLDPDDD